MNRRAFLGSLLLAVSRPKALLSGGPSPPPPRVPYRDADSVVYLEQKFVMKLRMSSLYGKFGGQ